MPRARTNLPDELELDLGLDEPDDPASLRARAARALRVPESALPAIALEVPNGRPDRRCWYWIHCANVAIATHGWPGRGAAHFWSLAVEEHFYLLWPFVVFAARRWVGPISAIIVIVTACARAYLAHDGVHHVTLFVLTPTRVDSLAVGALLAAMGHARGGLAARRGWLWLMVAVPGALLFWQEWVGSDTLPFAYVFGTQFTLMALFFAGVIGLVVEGGARSPAAKLLSVRWLRSLGTYSYGMYVWHLILDEAWTAIFPRVHVAAGGWALFGTLVSILERGLVSFLLAYASYHLVERHFLAWKRFVPYRKRAAAISSGTAGGGPR